ncbi:hypothetical protein CVT24_004981 [Panaeolus cyanescens]|uniref:Uncharacterized protein n=1 Tax=Panaeolus cyanescens TaxID=181874 RepID=A0A409VBU4_9AGAR|nr:hypothetical protein CVT24_004981 [Panaeolus cyanescens]
MSLQLEQPSTSDQIPQRFTHIEEDGPNDLDQDSNDEFDGDMDDDNLSFDGIYDNDSAEFDVPVMESPQAEFAPPPPPLCIICRRKPSYSQGGKSFPTCGYTCAAKLQEAINSNDPNDNTNSVNGNVRRDGYQRQGRTEINRATTFQGRANNESSNAPQTPQPSSTTYVDPNIRLLTQHLGGHNSQRAQTQPPLQAQEKRNVAAELPAPLAAQSHRSRPHPRIAYTQPQVQQVQQRHQPLPSSFRRHAQQNNDDNDLLYTPTQGPPLLPFWSGPPPSQASSSTSHGHNRYNSQGTDLRGRLPNYTPKRYLHQQQPSAVERFAAPVRQQPARPSGPPHPSVACVYCHRRPKQAGHDQCGNNCRESAKIACLLCKSRPKFGRYHLCGKSCKQIAVKSTPLILEAPHGHATYELVEKKFKDGWKVTNPPCPPIKKIFKIIENKKFLQPYDQYKKTVGNEVFRYHGTSRKCTLGTGNNTQLCNAANCALCNILRTSFKTSLANPSGAFGPGIYTSSASNKSYSYTGGGTGAVLLTKVILGKVRDVSGWNEVMSCPPGFNSVVFDRSKGTLNETIVYADDAIRPVFLIVF